MKKGYSSILAMLIAGTLLMTSLSAQAARFFRYVDESGKLVLSHTIPNDRVKYGYEIVDEYSRVIQTVAPQLSEEQYQAQLAAEEAQRQCKDAVTRVRSLYRSVDDIDYAEEQALASIETQIVNTKANLQQIRRQREDLESQAARQDLTGKTISAALLDNIESAKTQERNLEELIENRYAEKLNERKAKEFDRLVFRLSSCDGGLPEYPA